MKKLLLVLPLVTLLSACIVHVGHDEEDSYSSDWKKRQKMNQEMINDLAMGTDISEVRDRFGSPDFSEAFQSGEDNYTVLFYRTRHRHSDGDTSRDETTPLVFKNGKLEGWGETLLDRVSQR